MDEKLRAGLNKKSFSLFYHGGSIWSEHLDSLYGERELLLDKFNNDLLEIKKNTTSSFIAVCLDQSEVDNELLDYIVDSFQNLGRPLSKVVFVGLNFFSRRYIKKRSQDTSFMMECINDFEKAKEWLL